MLGKIITFISGFVLGTLFGTTIGRKIILWLIEIIKIKITNG